MYAIIKTGGKQLRARVGEIVRVERLGAAAGEKVEFKDVLLYFDGKKIHVGQPTVKDCVVSGTVIGEAKMKKIIVFKYKRRKNYRRKQGHRQTYTAVKVDKIKT